MHSTLAIAKRELVSYFTSPVAYVVTAAFLVIMGLLFGYVLAAPLQYRVASLSPVLGSVPVILLLVAPALTMRLLAEEQRSGTIELLLTAPVRDWEVVGGKFLASLALFLVAESEPGGGRHDQLRSDSLPVADQLPEWRCHRAGRGHH